MPLAIVSEIFRRDAPEVEQEPFEAALLVAGRPDVIRPSDALVCGLVQGDKGTSLRRLNWLAKNNKTGEFYFRLNFTGFLPSG